MKIKYNVIAPFIVATVLLLFGPTVVSATVETGWPAGTPNVCMDPADGFMDFELGIEETEVESTIPGLEFTTTYGLNWKYADIRTGIYNVNPYNDQEYEINGNFFSWLGTTGDEGRITFTGGTANYLSLLVSTSSGVMLDAYDIDGNFLATSGGASNNLNTGTLTRLTVEAADMAYVIVHDTGNYWLIDDICTDAPPPCQPVLGRSLGSESDRINLVFVPDEDYNGNMTDFLDDVDHKIDNRLGFHAPVSGNLDRFNFYYTELEGDVSGYPGGNCGQESSLPDNFLEKCPQADAIVVLHTNTFTDCNRSSGGVGIFSGEGTNDRSFIHEGGHGIFGLRDEYDSDRSSGSCTYTAYNTDRPLPSNIWDTEANCRSDADDQGWDSDQCYEFTPCQSDWWKLGDATLTTNDDKYNDGDFQFIMKDGYEFTKGWGVASDRRINWVFDNIPVTPEAPLPPPSGEKAIVLKLNISESGLALLDKSFVESPPPKYLPGDYSLTAKMFHPSGNMQGGYGFEDPRIAQVEEGGSGSYLLGNSDFTLILPYFNHVGMASIYTYGDLLLTVDLSAFASAINYPPVSDPDGPYEGECEGATTMVALDGTGSIDPDGDPISYAWTSDCPGASFDDATSSMPMLSVDTSSGCSVACNVFLSVNDDAGATATATSPVEISDTLPPAISFNAPGTITPPDAPISFTATAEDDCDDAPDVEITEFDCFKFTKKGRKIDKTESCDVSILDDTITIMDSGGVDTHISWSSRAIDRCGNVVDEAFETIVVNPAK